MKRITAFCITLFILLSVLSACGQTADVTSDFSAASDSSAEITPDSAIESDSSAEITSDSASDSDSGTERTYDGLLGSAGKMAGKTVVVSIFADDSTTSWDKDNNVDNARIESTLLYLKIAANWLTSSAGQYTDDVGFVCDWKQYPDLRYDAEFSETLVRPDGEMYPVQRQYIVDNIDSDGLLHKYGAENIIYLYLFNTDFSNEITPRTFHFGCGPGVDVEYVNLFTGACDYFMPPASYAHEMMHTFGAPDLYYANDTIPQSYVDYCESITSGDIMFSTYLGEHISNKFTELDAYYVGLADSSEAVEAWNLGLSEHELYGGGWAEG